MSAPPHPDALPDGVPVALDPDVRRLAHGTVLVGGDPGRLLRVSAAGLVGLERLAAGLPVGPAVRRLARTLVDGGLAHPRPRAEAAHDVVVVVPVRDRSAELARCLTALGDAVPVLVVDDGSVAPEQVAAVCARSGARVLRLPHNGGPAAARNAGLAATSCGLVAFVDSDVVVPPGWLDALVGHFTDPVVAAVAPRVRAQAQGRSLLAAWARERGPLDLGEREALVRPGGRVPYVPTAALLVRRAALPAGGFDPGLRYGEDVDLVWRLHDAGWAVRYDPRTVVRHAEPDRWTDWLVRRHRYGTSAGPLAARHGARLTPLVLPPLPTTAWALLAAGRPAGALAVVAASAWRLHRLLRATTLGRRDCARTAVRVTGQAVLGAVTGAGGAGLVATGPPLAALMVPRRTRRLAATVLLAPPLVEWLRRRPGPDPVRWTALTLLDDLAYASGVWRSAAALRTLGPVRPQRARPR